MPILYNLIIAHNGKPRYSKLEFCHSCGSQNVILNKTPQGRNSERNKHGMWQCFDCDASVAAHSDGNPQGYMADRNVRKLRYEFHNIMSTLRDQNYTYEDICTYLQARLSIEAEYLHGAWLTAGELVMAIKAMQERANRPVKNRPYVSNFRRLYKENGKDMQHKARRKKKGVNYV